MKPYSVERTAQCSGRSRTHRLRIAGGLMLVCTVAVMGGLIGAEGSKLPGMCNGRSDANVVLNAHAQEPKYILNISTDAIGVPYGVLILEKGATRLYADLFCRVWQHLPGQPTGSECEGELPPGTDSSLEGAITAHAVGMGTLRDGTEVLVRTDVRETEEGKFFRVRYRTMGSHDGHDSGPVLPSAHEDDVGCEDETWTRIPAEGWAPLKLLNLRIGTN